MKIIIAGAGEVGFHLAKLLSYESQEITLIDTNKESLTYADNRLDIKVIKGDSTSISNLKDANVHISDLVIAVTSSETTNITTCVLAKQLGAKKTIARISNTEFIEHKEEVGFIKFGIDELISPESLAAAEIELLLNQSAFDDTYEFENGALTMLGLNLSRTALFVGKSVKEAANLFPEIHFMPNRGNFSRGIFATAYTRFEGTLEAAKTLYKTYYKDAAFTFVSDEDIHLKQVVNTNKCIIHLHKHNNKLLVTSIIDNLLKGASGQAIQNMNLVFGFEETEGLQLKANFF